MRVAVITLLSLTCLSATPQRIISTSLTGDEILTAILDDRRRLLATSVLAANKLYSNIYHLPQSAHKLTATSIEQVVSLRPDLVVYSIFNRPDFIILARQLAINTVVLENFSHLEEILAGIVKLGNATGDVERARSLAAKMRQKLRDIATKTPRQRPRLLNFFADNTVMGIDTMFDSIVSHAGGVNVAKMKKIKGFRVINTETLATLNPDFIVIPRDIYEPTKVTKLLKNSPGWRGMTAVQKEKFIFVPARELMSTSHYAVSAVEKIFAGWSRR